MTFSGFEIVAQVIRKDEVEERFRCPPVGCPLDESVVLLVRLLVSQKKIFLGI